MDIAHFFKLIGNRDRLLILLLIAEFEEVCVCELTHALDISQPLASRHLSRMKREKILIDRSKGPWKYYRFCEELPAWQHEILDKAAHQKDDLLSQVMAKVSELRAMATENNPCPVR